jgi:hypothetical protein
MLNDDIESGLAQLVLERTRGIIETEMRDSLDPALVRLSDTLVRHPVVYQNDAFDKYNNSIFMTRIFRNAFNYEWEKKWSTDGSHKIVC